MSTLGDPSNPLPTTQPHSHTQIEPTGFLLAFHSSFCLSVSNLSIWNAISYCHVKYYWKDWENSSVWILKNLTDEIPEPVLVQFTWIFNLTKLESKAGSTERGDATSINCAKAPHFGGALLCVVCTNPTLQLLRWLIPCHYHQTDLQPYTCGGKFICVVFVRMLPGLNIAIACQVY